MTDWLPCVGNVSSMNRTSGGELAGGNVPTVAGPGCGAAACGSGKAGCGAGAAGLSPGAGDELCAGSAAFSEGGTAGAGVAWLGSLAGAGACAHATSLIAPVQRHNNSAGARKDRLYM